MRPTQHLTFILAAPLAYLTTIAAAISATDPRWHLQRIVQRPPLSAAQLISAVPAFDTSSLQLAPVTIYVVDSGVQIEHPDFAPSGRAIYGTNVLNPKNPPSDCNGHGTHVASLAAGVNSGVAPTAALVSVRVLDCDGTGTCSAIVAALDWILSDHATHNRTRRAAAVLSVGSTNAACAASARAARALWSAGIVVFAAAGNLGADSCKFYPARNDAVVAVGATALGDRLFKKSNVGACVELFAPGVDVLAAWIEPERKWKRATGTSMAAPLATGVAALILGADESLTADDVRDILKTSATRDVVRTSDGARKLTAATNRLLYSPWARLFDTVPRNVNADSPTSALHAAPTEPMVDTRASSPTPSPSRTAVLDGGGSGAVAEQDPPNSSATFLAVAVKLSPRVRPAMAFSATRVARAVAAVAGLSTSKVVARRAPDAVRGQEGTEPESVELRLYVAVSRSLVAEYTRRIEARGSGTWLQDAAHEDASLSDSAARAVGAVDTIPAALDDSDGRGRADGSGGSSTTSIIIIVGSVVGALTVAIALGVTGWNVVRARRLERPATDAISV